jgi:hypothetical protein
MKNEELLLAISDMMDQKLDSIHERMDTFDTKLDAVDERLSADIRSINISLENVVIPRIKHIEQCYVSTSERYINEAGRINGLNADVQIIKSVVQEHSIQLQKIS